MKWPGEREGGDTSDGKHSGFFPISPASGHRRTDGRTGSLQNESIKPAQVTLACARKPAQQQQLVVRHLCFVPPPPRPHFLPADPRARLRASAKERHAKAITNERDVPFVERGREQSGAKCPSAKMNFPISVSSPMNK